MKGWQKQVFFSPNPGTGGSTEKHSVPGTDKTHPWSGAASSLPAPGLSRGWRVWKGLKYQCLPGKVVSGVDGFRWSKEGAIPHGKSWCNPQGDPGHHLGEKYIRTWDSEEAWSTPLEHVLGTLPFLPCGFWPWALHTQYRNSLVCEPGFGNEKWICSQVKSPFVSRKICELGSPREQCLKITDD